MKRTFAFVLASSAGLASGQIAGENTGVKVLNSQESAAASVSGQAMVVAHKLEVGSRSNSAIDVNGQGRIECNEIHITGNYSLSGGRAQLLGPVWIGADAPDDPIAPRFAEGFSFDSLVDLATRGALATDLGTLEASSGDEVRARPGFYSGGANISGGDVTLAPGIYIFAGDVSITSHSEIYGHDVTIVLLGSMNVAGQATLRLDAPDEGEYAGISILMPPTNSSTISLSGGSNLVVLDTIWAPAGELSVTGHSNNTLSGPIVGSTVVVDTLKAAGRGLIVVGYSESASMAKLPQYD